MNKQIVLMLVGLICLTGIAYAGVSANYNLSWHVLSGGGGGQMDSASYALSSAVGQIIGSSESSNYRLGAGYWYGAVSTSTPQTKFDTGPGTYPSISGAHNGTITPNQTITVQKLYTYPCAGTGGHTEYARLWNATLDVNATWNGYTVDGHNISFDVPFTLVANETYNYTIITGSYPQIIHATSKAVTGGTITCTSFVDANGNTYSDWIPAIILGE
jgi:hypothetical protein